ncbi:MAG: flavin-dependent monooxygenase QhpG [Longimicrobiales bacterium]
MQYDVLVIGGGPAGAAAARLLSSWSHSVLLLTRPSPQAGLAESIPPSCMKLLDRIGAVEAIEHAAFVHSTGNTVYWGGQERVALFPPGEYGYQVERSTFDALLLDLAENIGAEVLTGATVRNWQRTPDGWSVSYLTQSGEQHATARWLLDCSGRAGVMAKHGLRRPQPGRRTLALIGNWEIERGFGLTDETHTLVESHEAGWAWSVPISRTTRCVALMLDPELTQVESRARLEQQYQAELARTVKLGALVQNARLVTTPWACEASAYDAERVSGDAMLLVGDAASFVDPLSSFGVKKALASAWLAAVVTHTSLMQPELTTAASTFYEARERHMFESLRHRSAELAGAAAARHPHAFWEERAETDVTDVVAEPDSESLRQDAALLQAFEELKQRASITLRVTSRVRRVELPIVRGNRIVLVTHLVMPTFPGGIRYVRGVDLVKLADLATQYRQVPDLYDAYNRAAPNASLPDFLGALSLLIAKGALEHP